VTVEDTGGRQVVIDGYNASADGYAADRHRFDINDVLARLQSACRPGGRILDVGCGSGQPVAGRLANAGFAVTGVDISERMLSLAAAGTPGVRLAHMDMQQFGFRPAVFDGLIACYSLIHVPMAEHARVIASFADLLAPGGVLLFSSGHSEWEDVEHFYAAPIFWSHPHPKVTRQAVYDAGLSPVLRKCGNMAASITTGC
jgi:2-polyprenyl-3-methyl-5-hydroxy-6-metoxy-1,4-benzoquinol methylase